MGKSATIDIQVYIDNVEYVGKIGRVSSTFLGVEDHGMFAYTVEIDFGGALQSTGMRHLDGTEALKNLVKTVGGHYSSWEDLIGKRIISLYTKPYSYNNMIAGFSSLNGERTLLFNA